MRNMNMTLERSSEAVLLTCPMLGMKAKPCPTSTSHRLVINLADIHHPPLESLPITQQGVCACHNSHTIHFGESTCGVCPACEGKHRSHTYDEHCRLKPAGPYLQPVEKEVRFEGQPAPVEASKTPSEQAPGEPQSPAWTGNCGTCWPA